MNIHIQSLHFTANQELLDFVTEKVNKLGAHNSQIESFEVTLRLDNASYDENKICEIRVVVPGNDLFAKRQEKSFEEATTEVVNALESQLVKMKSKSEDR
jgi:putative sigma-54 modulation protein